jgi:ribosomal protein L14E/L6E/L27E
MMQKIHQLSSGTCKFEDGTSMVIDYSKAEFIKWKFENEKIAIFYKFKEELNALKSIYGSDLTEDLDEFNNTDKCIALQIVASREGISLKNAKYLVYYNIDFSATSYWQSRDRLTTFDRPSNDVYWIFSKGGIENKIYKTVMNKKNYTLSNFKQDY